MERLAAQLEALQKALNEAKRDLAFAERDALDLHDESTAELEQHIRDVDALNLRIRQNLDKQKAEEDAAAAANDYNSLTVQLEALRQSRRDLLTGAALPLPGLTVEDGKLLYRGHPWDGMSGSEQLIVGTAIARALNPRCGFVLMDKLEQMDVETLDTFGVWLKQQGLQAIATRVSTGDECTVIIEDGAVQDTITSGHVPQLSTSSPAAAGASPQGEAKEGPHLSLPLEPGAPVAGKVDSCEAGRPMRSAPTTWKAGEF